MKIRERFEDKFLDWVENTPLLEMAFSRKEIESKITNLGSPIIEHLIKILKWKDDQNFEKHCRDITNWLYQVQNFKLKDGRRPKDKDYFKWLFLDNGGDVKNIRRRIKALYNYHQLTILKSDEEVFLSIAYIIDKISKDISNDNFEDIKNYI